METTRYKRVMEQDRNRGFHMNWPTGNSGEYQNVISLGLQAIIKDVSQIIFSSLNIDLCKYIMSRYGLFFILMYI